MDRAEYVKELQAFRAEALAAGDEELAGFVRTAIVLAEVRGESSNGHICVRQDGTRFKFENARKHIRAGRPGTVQTRAGGSSPLADEMRRLSAQCRELTAQAKRRNPAAARRDLDRINAAMGIRTAAPQHADTRPVYDEDGEEMDEFDFVPDERCAV